MSARRLTRGALSAAALLHATGCGDEVLLHRLDEPGANQVLVALGDAGVPARVARAGGEDSGLAIAVAPSDAARARSVLSASDLPRARPPGFAELFSGAGLVPTAAEEHARYLHALAGELARTLEGLDGVLSARVHLAVPAPDPLRPEARRTPRASVLLRCRTDARERVEAHADGVRRLVAGAAEGLEPSSVAVVVAPSGPAFAAQPAPRSAARWWLAGGAVASAVGLAALALARRRGEPA